MEKENVIAPDEKCVGTIRLNDGKAGMQGLDKEAINKVILETSQGTPFFAFQEKRQASIDSKVKQLKEMLGTLTTEERMVALQKMDTLGEVLESERDLSHSIVHIDMDAFYAAVETQDNPKLAGKPMAVGSSSMLSTSSYEARRFGVRAAMPGFIAKKLCPHLIVVPCHFDRYREVSGKVVEVARQYDRNLCMASLDEMYLDLTPYIKREHKMRFHQRKCIEGNGLKAPSLDKDSLTNAIDHSTVIDDGCDSRIGKKRKLSFCDGDSEDSSTDYCETLESHYKKRKHEENTEQNPVVDRNEDCTACNMYSVPIIDEERDHLAYQIVKEIREKIFLTTGLTASAGIGPNVMLAKVCSDQNKPNGQFQLKSTVKDVQAFVASLAVKKIGGIGPVQGQILNALGIHTCSDLWTQRDIVACLFTQISVDFYMRVAKGIGRTTVKSEYVRKSIGVERTFQEIHDKDELQKKCEELCQDAVEDLQMHNMVGKVVVLKLKTTKFRTLTRNQTLTCYTSDISVILAAAKRLLDLEIAALSPEPLRLRLMGIRIANLVEESSIASAESHTVNIKDFLKKIPKPTSSLPNNEKSNDTECRTSPKVPQESRSDYMCPVCNVSQHSQSLEQFNSHIDSCLNKSTIKEILAEETGRVKKPQNTEKQNARKIKMKHPSRIERKIDDYFH